MEIMTATNHAKVLAPGEGLRLQSGPGWDLIFKVTGEDTGAPSIILSLRWRQEAGRRCTFTTIKRKPSMF